MNAEELCRKLRTAGPPLFECSSAPRQGIRVRIPFLYADGSIIDVFVLKRGGRIKVTDFGEALGWLRLQSPGDRLSPEQRRLVEDVWLTLGIERSSRSISGMYSRRASSMKKAMCSFCTLPAPTSLPGSTTWT